MGTLTRVRIDHHGPGDIVPAHAVYCEAGEDGADPIVVGGGFLVDAVLVAASVLEPFDAVLPCPKT